MPFSSARPTCNDTATANLFGGLSFEDHFNGLDINRSVWDAGAYNPDFGTKNYDCKTYTDSGGVQRSVLRIWPQRDASLDTAGTSSIYGDSPTPNGFFRRDITTYNKGFRQTYGFFEASMKINSGRGCWPGWWLFAPDGSQNEFDIIEAYPGGDFASTGWGPNNYVATLWSNSNSRYGFKKLSDVYGSGTDLRAGFHTYGCSWTPNNVSFWYDGKLLVSFGATFSRAVFLYLQLWFPDFRSGNGMESGGYPNTTDTPQGSSNSVEVDYVRCWLYNGAGGASGPAATDGAAPGGTTTGGTTGGTGSTGGQPNTFPNVTLLTTPQRGEYLVDVPFGNVDMTLVGDMSYRDEFQTGALDTAAWNKYLWYSAESGVNNYDVANNALRIWPTSDFSPRTIDTDGKFAQKYGYFEASVKLCSGNGTWPAFWLFGHPDDFERPEIDIFEAYPGGAAPWSDGAGHPTDIQLALHKVREGTYASTLYSPKMSELIGGVMRFDDKFHVIGLMWTKDFIQWYVDGTAIGEKYFYNGYFQWPMYILFDLWYGSSSGSPDGSTPLGVNNAYEIDWVRVWKMKDGSSSVVTNLPAPTLYGTGGSTGGTGGGTTPSGAGNYVAGDQFTVRYEAGAIKYLKNGAVVRSVSNVGDLRTFYVDSSFYTPGGKITNVSFGRLGTVDWSQVTGAGKPEDGATKGATLGENVDGQIDSTNATTYIAPKSITNALIGDTIQSDGYVAGVSGWRIDKLGNMEMNSAIFRGILGANTVKADNIVSRSVTRFEWVESTVINNGVSTFNAIMDSAGELSVVAVLVPTLANVDSTAYTAGSASCKFEINIDGTVRNVSSNGICAATQSSTLLLQRVCSAGIVPIRVFYYHTFANANVPHTLFLQIFRTYR